MLRQPKRTKYRKAFKFKGKTKGRNQVTPGSMSSLARGEYGLRSLEIGRVTARQLEATRRTRRHHRNRIGKVSMIVFPDLPVTKKPREVRMGKGKGNIEYWTTRVRPGTIRFEVRGVAEKKVRNALRCAGKKLPVRTNIVKRNQTKAPTRVG
jgi:large subunit ribosomal protein L16